MVAALVLAGCSGGAGEKRYQFDGAIVAVDPANKTATIAAAKIGDWMDAMTMEYPIKPDSELAKILPQMFPMKPTSIRRTLKLNRPIYRRTSAYGHFGRAPEKDGGFSWERLDLVSQLKSHFKA